MLLVRGARTSTCVKLKGGGGSICSKNGVTYNEALLQLFYYFLLTITMVNVILKCADFVCAEDSPIAGWGKSICVIRIRNVGRKRVGKGMKVARDLWRTSSPGQLRLSAIDPWKVR